MRRLLWICGIVVYCLSALACAQRVVTKQPAVTPSAARGAAFSPRSAGDMPGSGAMQLNVVVTDKSGRPVAGLTAADFTLLDNNQPARIVSFHAYNGLAQPPDPPVEAILLFDTVNTDFTAVSYARQQVENFLHQDGGRLAQPTAIYWLTNDGVEAHSQPTQDGNALAAQVEAAESHLRTVTRSAGVYGAIERLQFSVKMLSMVAENEAKIPGRKLLIWAGPGWPMLEGPGIDISNKTQQAVFGQIVELSTVLREAQIDLYSVAQGTPGPETYGYESYLKGVKKPSQAALGNLSLKVLAVQSGGIVVPPTNDLAESIVTCLRDAGVFYTLTFEPPPADGPNEYHELKLKVDKPGLTARTNSGYYDQPVGARQQSAP